MSNPNSQRLCVLTRWVCKSLLQLNVSEMNKVSKCPFYNYPPRFSVLQIYVFTNILFLLQQLPDTEVKNKLTITRGEVERDNGGKRGKGHQGICIKDTWTKPKERSESGSGGMVVVVVGNGDNCT